MQHGPVLILGGTDRATLNAGPDHTPAAAARQRHGHRILRLRHQLSVRRRRLIRHTPTLQCPPALVTPPAGQYIERSAATCTVEFTCTEKPWSGNRLLTAMTRRLLGAMAKG